MSKIFKYPEEIQRVFYTINAIESLRKVTKNIAAFPDDEAIIKIIAMRLKNGQCQYEIGDRH